MFHILMLPLDVSHWSGKLLRPRLHEGLGYAGYVMLTHTHKQGHSGRRDDWEFSDRPGAVRRYFFATRMYNNSSPEQRTKEEGPNRTPSTNCRGRRVHRHKDITF